MGIKPRVTESPFWDYQATLFSGTTCLTLFVMDPLLGSTGLMATYPQHAEGYFNGTVFRLRQHVTVQRIEMRVWLVGSQTTAIAAGDLYNRVRLALYKVGAAYTDSTEQYLANGFSAGTSINDVRQVYVDHTWSLSARASLTTTGAIIPATASTSWTVTMAQPFSIYSTDSTGSGSLWNTTQEALRCDVVSDSALSPNPEVQLDFRFFFRFD